MWVGMGNKGGIFGNGPLHDTRCTGFPSEAAWAFAACSLAAVERFKTSEKPHQEVGNGLLGMSYLESFGRIVISGGRLILERG